jgi:hypothetical protein
MDSEKDYARKWRKREKEEVDTLSEWIKAVDSNSNRKTQKINEHQSKICIFLFIPTYCHMLEKPVLTNGSQFVQSRIMSVFRQVVYRECNLESGKE